MFHPWIGVGCQAWQCCVSAVQKAMLKEPRVGFTYKLLYFERSPPWQSFVIVSGISSLEVYMAYIVWLLAVYLTFYSDIPFWHSIWHLFTHSFWHPFWHLFWHFLWHSKWYSFWYSIWHLFWHSFWHIFGHSIWHSILAFCVASIVAINSAILSGIHSGIL